MDNLADLFLRTASRHPDSPFLWTEGRWWSYRELQELVYRAASFLRSAGCKPGDRVLAILPNGVAYVASYFASAHQGTIFVGVNPDTTVEELACLVGHCEPRVIILTPTAETLVRQALARSAGTAAVATAEDLLAGANRTASQARVSPDAPAQIIYTSGTSGRPKGVLLSHRNLLANTRSIVSYLKLTAADSVLVILPFFYSYGNSLLLTHVAVGGRLVLAPDFVFLNRVLDLMEQEQVTGFSGVPSSFAMLIHRSDFLERPLPHLRYLTCAGGPLPLATVKLIREAKPHVDLYLMYGQTEASARLSSLMPWEVDERPGSIGRGIPGVRLQVLDETGKPVAPGEVGEIVAQGENIMLGYYKDPVATAAVLRPEGLRTGDLATVDEDGYIYVVGRKSDLIKSGAYRIHPREIEEVIAELPGVAEVAVAGVPHDVFGEVPVAFVVRGRSNVTIEEVRQHCVRRLPRYKRVHDVVFVDALPKTPSGKVRRKLLVEQYTATNVATP